MFLHAPAGNTPAASTARKIKWGCRTVLCEALYDRTFPSLSVRIFYHSSPYSPNFSYTGHPGGPQTQHSHSPSALYTHALCPNPLPLALWVTGFISAFKSRLKSHHVLRSAFSNHPDPVTLYLLHNPICFWAAWSKVMVLFVPLTTIFLPY